jgi:hypothetical protein
VVDAADLVGWSAAGAADLAERSPASAADLADRSWCHACSARWTGPVVR